MFINNLDPTLVQIGSLEIRYYGIVYVIGFMLAYFFLLHKRETLSMDREEVGDLVFYLFIGLLVGARIFHFLFSEPSIFIKDPLELLMIWHGGMSFFGALIGLLITLIIFCRKTGKNCAAIADTVSLPAAFALILGRIANFINSELVGRISDVPWCVVFQRIDSVCRHPYQLYAALSHLLLSFLLLIAYRRKNLKHGMIFFLFVVGYSMLRFITDFFRADPTFLGLTVWQYVSVTTIVVVISAVKINKFL